MNIDCRWLEQNLEGFFCDRLSANEMDQLQLHVDNCSECQGTLREFQAVDPLIRQLFQHDLAVAQAPQRVRQSRLGMPVYAAATALIVLSIWLGVKASEKPATLADPKPPATIAAVRPTPIAPATTAIVKSEGQPTVERAKPAPAVKTPSNAPTPAPKPDVDQADKRPPFLVSDAAGYSRTLSDYRNRTLIFGVWSPKDTHAIATLQRLYETYGSNPKVRILGISNESMAKPANGTFPVVYNENSQLLGAQPSDIVIVDGTGTVRFRGSLNGNPNMVVKTVNSALGSLGIR